MLSAYEHRRTIPYPALLVFGPFMLPEQRAAFAARAAQLDNVRAITFNARLESLMARAAGVVAMGGYNTFCEILSFDKRAVIVPRTAPRLEQFIRTQRAAELGLLTLLSEQDGRDPECMADALCRLPQQPPPHRCSFPASSTACSRSTASPGIGWTRVGLGASRLAHVSGPDHGAAQRAAGRVAFVLKGYPRLSETFIAQEMLALERRGLEILIVSLRQPTDRATHPVHRLIRAPVLYLPEYLHQEPGRVWRGWLSSHRRSGYRRAQAAWLADVRRDPTPNRVRRFGQAVGLGSRNCRPTSGRLLHISCTRRPRLLAMPR